MIKVTTVKIDKKYLKLLDRVQAEILIKHGIKIPKKDIVEKALEWALSNKEFVEKKLLEKRDKKRILEMLKRPIDWGIKDASVKVDEYLYGE